MANSTKIDNETLEMLIDEISWELDNYDSIKLDCDELIEKIYSIYNNSLGTEENIKNIYDVLSKRYISEYENGIKKCDEEINSFKTKLSNASNNNYLKNLYTNLINEEIEKKKKITERFETLKSVDK